MIAAAPNPAPEFRSFIEGGGDDFSDLALRVFACQFPQSLPIPDFPQSRFQFPPHRLPFLRVSMPEVPVTTIGTITEVLSATICHVELPNGKIITGHLPKRLHALAGTLAANSRVHLELTPYDFEKARIAGLAHDA
jgi:translation initiation factor IF-1